MKISLITLHRVFNYGSVLQTYATQRVIEELGHSCEVVDYYTEQRTFKRLLAGGGKYRSKNVMLNLFFYYARFLSLIIKKITFGSFIKKYIHLSKLKYIDSNSLQRNPPQADVYIVGSDQVWNSVYNEGIDKGFFLDFVNNGSNKIAFSSSFGLNKLKNEEMDETKELLLDFQAISVREQQAVEIIEELGLDTPIVVIDPTLQISSSIWRQLASKRLVKQKYLLLMLLYNEDNNATEYARKIADEKGLVLVKLSWDLFKDKRIDKLFSHRSPQDFLSLFSNADYIVTNSFHGLAFSLTFEKQFTIVKRNEFNSRIESLLQIVGLEERLVDTDLDMQIVNKSIEYSAVGNLLNIERDVAKQFLIRNISLGDNK